MADRPHLEEETDEQREDREAYEAWAAERGWADRWKALAKRLWAERARMRAMSDDKVQAEAEAAAVMMLDQVRQLPGFDALFEPERPAARVALLEVLGFAYQTGKRIGVQAGGRLGETSVQGDPRADLEALGYMVTVQPHPAVRADAPPLVDVVAERAGVRHSVTGLTERTTLMALAYRLVVPELRGRLEDGARRG